MDGRIKLKDTDHKSWHDGHASFSVSYECPKSGRVVFRTDYDCSPANSSVKDGFTDPACSGYCRYKRSYLEVAVEQIKPCPYE